MLIRNSVMCTEKKGIKIVKKENKYGLISDSETILSMEYDNLFIYGRYLYVLHKDGKIGAIQFNDADLSYKVIADTKYDTLDFYWHDLLFSDGKEFVYYFCDADHYGHESVRVFTNISIESRDSLIYANDAENCYIIQRQSGKILWHEKKRQESFVGKPCYSYCGTVSDGKPMFYDLTNDGYIVPRKNSYTRRSNSFFKKSAIQGDDTDE